jgi:hypothetical protein
MSDDIYLVTTGETPQAVAPIGFGSLDVKERKHLEDWVVRNPKILGEPLLVITPEFDRFDKSARRLDVLALDKAGVLVVVELKLDIAGTFADQQAIRYAAFCSTMTMMEVVEQYALHHHVTDSDAEARICEFLEMDELSELGDGPRIILAAGSMDDAELTSCVLWLRRFGVDITCVELTPYRLSEQRQLVLVPKVIIPLPETRAYMVSVEKKEASRARDRADARELGQFWAGLAGAYNALEPLLPVTASSRGRYLQIRIGGKSIHYEWVVYKRRSEIAVAIHFESNNPDENQAWLSEIRRQSSEIQAGISFPFQTKPWGRKWAAAWFGVPFAGQPDADTTRKCAGLMKELVARTYDTLKAMTKGAGHDADA